MDEKLLYKIHVKGRVQGVGFRWNAVRVARNLGITGFVKNLSDGNVYIEAEGSMKQLEAYTEWCRKGPGDVDSVTFETFPPVKYTEFRVEY